MVVKDGLVESFEVDDVPGATGGDLNLSGYEIDYILSTVDGTSNVMVQIGSDEPIVYYWRDGVYLGHSGVGGIEDPGGIPDLRSVTYLANDS